MHFKRKPKPEQAPLPDHFVWPEKYYCVKGTKPGANNLWDVTNDFIFAKNVRSGSIAESWKNYRWRFVMRQRKQRQALQPEPVPVFKRKAKKTKSWSMPVENTPIIHEQKKKVNPFVGRRRR